MYSLTSDQSADIVRVKIEHLKKLRVQNLIGQFLAGPLLTLIAWDFGDHRRLVLFTLCHHLMVWFNLAAFTIPFRPAELSAMPQAPYLAIAMSSMMLGSVAWFDPSSAREPVFIFATGLAIFATVAGCLITVGRDTRMFRISLSAMLAPFFLAALVFGHATLALAIFCFFIVVVIAVSWVADSQDELVLLRLEAAERAAQAEDDAATDQLTGLLNRHGLSLLDGNLVNVSVTTFFIDLDHFKEINDNHGHHVGDAVLKLVAKRLESVTRESDVVVRLGGDEFVVLAYGLSPVASGAYQERLSSTFQAPLRIAGLGEIQVAASIGTTRSANSELNLSELLRQSDRAMYESKNAKRTAPNSMSTA